PDLALTVVPTNEHFDQFGCVKAIGLRAALATIDLDRRRVDHPVLNAISDQESMHPKAVASGLVATDYPRLLGKCEATLGPLNLNQQLTGAAPDHGAHPRPLSQPNG